MSRSNSVKQPENEPGRTMPKTTLRSRIGATALATLLLVAVLPRAASSASGEDLQRSASAALANLCAQNPSAALLRDRATAVLVFPSILKAGFMFGGQIGQGVLFQGGRAAGYYSSVAASYGFQAGIQTFGYALFLMKPAALDYLNKSAGFEIGVGPSLVVVDAGVARSLTTSTIQKDIYAFIFNQAGLMAGVGLQGSKITRISK